MECRVRESKVTVKIPRQLYRKIQLVIENSGFSSPTDFVVFVLRDLLGEAEVKGHEVLAALRRRTDGSRGAGGLGAAAGSPVPPAAVEPPSGGAADSAEEFSAVDLETVKQKLKNLGYL